MDPLIIIKLISALVTLPLSFKGYTYFFKTKSEKTNILKHDHEFAYTFFKRIENSKKINSNGETIPLHPYVLQKGYQAIAGTDKIPVSIIKYLLSLKDPYLRLEEFVFSQYYLDKIEDEHQFKIKFKKKYQTKFSRKWRVWLYISIYAFIPLSILAVFLFSLYEVNLFQSATFPFWIITGLYGTAYIYCAIHCLIKASQIVRGEKLVATQELHTPIVFTKK